MIKSRLHKLMVLFGAMLTLVGCGVIEEELFTEDTTQETVASLTEGGADLGSQESASVEFNESDYTEIEVDGGDMSGHREPLVKVNIGFGDREYYAYTNEHGQVVRVTAKEIILQDTETEDVKSNNRYYWNQASVPGTELPDIDKGHIIADSLGGVGNAYNITPQDAYLNRHGDQAYMERNIRQAGGATDYEAIIYYPNTETQIPSSYKFTYTIKGNKVVDEFENLNPEELNKKLKAEGKLESQQPTKKEKEESAKKEDTEQVKENVSVNEGEYVDEDGNGLIKGSTSGIYHTPESPYYERTTSPKEMFKTVKEAEDAGYREPK